MDVRILSYWEFSERFEFCIPAKSLAIAGNGHSASCVPNLLPVHRVLPSFIVECISMYEVLRNNAQTLTVARKEYDPVTLLLTSVLEMAGVSVV